MWLHYETKVYSIGVVIAEAVTDRAVIPAPVILSSKIINDVGSRVMTTLLAPPLGVHVAVNVALELRFLM